MPVGVGHGTGGSVKVISCWQIVHEIGLEPVIGNVEVVSDVFEKQDAACIHGCLAGPQANGELIHSIQGAGGRDVWVTPSRCPVQMDPLSNLGTGVTRGPGPTCVVIQAGGIRNRVIQGQVKVEIRDCTGGESSSRCG